MLPEIRRVDLMSKAKCLLPKGGGWASYLFALCLIALALFARLGMAPVDAGLQYVTFFPAVTLAVVIGGLGPGLLATTCGLVLATVIFTPPFYEVSAFKLQISFWSNLVFFADGLIVCFSIEAMHRYRLKYVAERDEARSNALLLSAINQQLQDSEAFSRSIFDSRSEQVAVLNEQGEIVALNEAWRSFAAQNGVVAQRSQCQGMNYLSICETAVASGKPSAAGAAEAAAGIRAVLKGSLPEFNLEYPCHSINEERWFNLRVTPLQGVRRGAVLAHEDISRRKVAENELRIAAIAFESQQSIVVTDAKAIILRVNRAFVENIGYTAEELLGQPMSVVKSDRHDAAFYAAMWATILRDGVWQGEIWNRRKSGEVYPEWITITAVKNQFGQVTNHVGTHTDITTRKAAEDEIKHLAFYDPLTRLPNRRLLMDRLRQALMTSSRMEREGALIFVDLDNFKTLNDTLGHDKGDLLLQQVAQRLESCVREGDTVARLGGDEFVVVLEVLSEQAAEARLQAENVGRKILVTLGQPYLLADLPFTSTPSIGITLFGRREVSEHVLIKEADTAMYQAKRAGRNRLCFYTEQV